MKIDKSYDSLDNLCIRIEGDKEKDYDNISKLNYNLINHFSIHTELTGCFSNNSNLIRLSFNIGANNKLKPIFETMSILFENILEKEFVPEMAEGAEKYFKINKYVYISGNTLLLGGNLNE